MVGGPGGLAPLVATGATAQISALKGPEKMLNDYADLPSKDELLSCLIGGDRDHLSFHIKSIFWLAHCSNLRVLK
jgi:hypothetical protein